MTEHIILVAVSMKTDGSREDAERALHRLMPSAGHTHSSADAISHVGCWWVAEDDRRDGSDDDSAVFVTPGKQSEASHLLWRHGLTPAHNVIPVRDACMTDTR